MSLVESPPLAGAALTNVTTWTDEREALLTRLWLANDMTAIQIADEIGGFEYCGDGGKNAVIGKARRLKLKAHRPGRNLPPRIRTPKPKPKTKHVARFIHDKRKAEAKEPRRAEWVPAAELVIPRRQRCSLLELNDDKCHWPVGDPGTPDFYFCGGKAASGMPYCGSHCRIAYQAPHGRRERRSVPA